MMIRKADWQIDKSTLSDIRHKVFVLEQHVPVELELDEHDPCCHHWMATIRGEAVGVVRMSNKGVIGRMAVLRPYRKQGIGRKLLDAAIAYAKSQNWRLVTLSAQDHAIGFYAAAGFTPYGERFMDAGIPHQAMQMVLMSAVNRPGQP
ncbi:Acetyltransferase [Zhongshania aliphaticivorans]|uniref:Acetyltransferase n=1 Tax=Zhongshania aliphaticivorans TaxID=1470434 RepID=A0A5S9NEJ5_9GAMM|nr:GNAT family N-acetyltransferase [Zhongshania aliphaticivorans]CAA0088753.1 Acetyltransferase [Zhongshania aliphaticivorans]CAA0095073.1 Acetyltransferase [Zhongshania aliphaticivorans]